jgi:hypothetical protein
VYEVIKGNGTTPVPHIDVRNKEERGLLAIATSENKTKSSDTILLFIFTIQYA